MKSTVLDKSIPVGSELTAVHLRQFLEAHMQIAATHIELEDTAASPHNEAYLTMVINDEDDTQVFVAFSEEDFKTETGITFYLMYGELLVAEFEDIMYAIPYWYDKSDIGDLPSGLQEGLETLFNMTSEWAAGGFQGPDWESELDEKTKEATAELMKGAPTLPPASFPDSMISMLDSLQKEVTRLREKLSKVTHPKKDEATETSDAETEAAPEEAASDESETEATSEE